MGKPARTNNKTAAREIFTRSFAVRGTAIAAFLAVGFVACEPLFMPSTFSAPVFDDDGNVTKREEVTSLKFAEGAIEVSAAVLNRGMTTFKTYCASCHGVQGDGNGPAGKGLIPPPRNFTTPFIMFKFASVTANELPTDDDLVRTVTRGLHGTAMLQWSVPEQRLREVIQYIKTFSKRWKDEAPGKPLEITADPNTDDAKIAAAIEKGKSLYYTKTNCHLCHPTYVKQSEFDDLMKKAGKESGPLRPDATWSIAKPSETYNVSITPPDFTWHELRSITKIDPNAGPEAQKQQSIARRRDMFQAISTGIGGTAMPTWKNAITDEEIWALTHYVDSLSKLKSNPKAREEFMGGLRNGK
jgi:mono/diheme cytochrome c family protein